MKRFMAIGQPLVLCALLFLGLSVQADDQTGGIFWDPAQPGQAVTLFIDENTVAGVWYVYDENENPLWVTFIGALADDGTVVADLLEFDGPALGDNWNPLQVVPVSVGTVTVTFLDLNSVQFDYTLNGVTGTLLLEPFEVVVDSDPDSDEDGVPDADDQCPDTDLELIVEVGDCETDMVNEVFDNGCSVSDEINACEEGARNHGQFVSCITQLANGMRDIGLISGAEKGAITSCAARSTIP